MYSESALSATPLYLPISDKSILLQVLLIISMQIGTISYGTGVGSIPYTMVVEVFPPKFYIAGSCIVQGVRYLNHHSHYNKYLPKITHIKVNKSILKFIILLTGTS